MAVPSVSGAVVLTGVIVCHCAGSAPAKPACARRANWVAALARVPASTTLPAHGCQAPETAAVAALPVRARRQVLGQGRLQFYSAPDAACPLRGIFILPGEPVVPLQQAARFTAVHYVNPRTGGQASGWVLSERLGG